MTMSLPPKSIDGVCPYVKFKSVIELEPSVSHSKRTQPSQESEAESLATAVE